ncbi:MAG TPA: SDR family NAD(P)-dependent oxidoreductase, partial [Thermomicrobiales bacterium]
MAGTGVLAGKFALITGAGTGLGKASARALASEGATVVVTELPDRLDRAEATIAEVRAAGGEGKALPLNVLDLAQIERCVADAAAVGGRLDVLVNNAGINIPKRAFEVT